MKIKEQLSALWRNKEEIINIIQESSTRMSNFGRNANPIYVSTLLTIAGTTAGGYIIANSSIAKELREKNKEINSLKQSIDASQSTITELSLEVIQAENRTPHLIFYLS